MTVPQVDKENRPVVTTLLALTEVFFVFLGMSLVLYQKKV